MTTRVPLPVTLELAVALDRVGDLCAAARRLAELQDPALHPLSALLLDMLQPLMAMGAVTEDNGRRSIDTEALLRFYLGVMRYDAEKIWRLRLNELAAALSGWRDAQAAPRVSPPDVETFIAMMQRHPDKGDRTDDQQPSST